ncbi:unnamed protein product [Adineta steineri]|uniref:Uncharacterized protein n=1 Tax=Adineta steineri TaxID=433720 RepID=A0A820G365_9BILA|nr:unnamed protein product [Adineta steineri]
MTQYHHNHQHHLKRLQHPANSFNSRSTLSNNGIIQKSHEKRLQPFNNPVRNHARRGGGSNGRASNRTWRSAASLPKRTIYYDLAESFMDHSTNPLSSDLYKIRFKHSRKQWPDGRFINYKEKLDKTGGCVTAVTCERNWDVIPKEKYIERTNHFANTFTVYDRAVEEHKKKLAEELQKNFVEKEKRISAEEEKRKLVEEQTKNLTEEQKKKFAEEEKKKLAEQQMNIYANIFGYGIK